jgi:hypothetical protein
MPAWTSFYVIFFWPCLAGTVAFCIWRGDRVVRIAALTFASAMVADRLAVSQHMYAQTEFGVAFIDLGLAATLTALSVRHPRLWLMLLTATQFLAVLGHATRIAGLQHSRLVYALLTGSAAYPALLLLLWGALTARKPMRRDDTRSRSAGCHMQ